MPQRNIKIALLPIDIIPFNPEANLDMVNSRLADLDSDTDLVVLPETFTTGFTPRTDILQEISEDDSGNTVRRLKEMSNERNVALWGSYMATDGDGHFFNRGFMIAPGEEPLFYNKRHLFSHGGESRVLTHGTELAPIVEFRTWRLKMSICYDIRFPVWNRAIANNYDVLIVPANWAHSRYYAWKQMLIARAIENQTYVMGCNREGFDLYGDYNRYDSCAFNYWGKDMADKRQDGTIYAVLDAEQFNTDRQRFAPWHDADTFTLNI